MDREAYNKCMSPYIKGTGKTKEQRQLDFCSGAKICTGKAKDMEEAQHICLTTPKKEKEPRTSGGIKKGARCASDMENVATCVIEKITPEKFNTEALLAALQECACGKKPKKKNKAEQAMEKMSDEELKALANIAEVMEYYSK